MKIQKLLVSMSNSDQIIANFANADPHPIIQFEKQMHFLLLEEES